MSVRIMNRVFEGSRQKGTSRLMMLCIADNADDSGLAFPGMDTLAAKMGGVSRRSAGNRVEALAKTTELAVYPRKGASHDYIVFTGMTISQAKAAIRKMMLKRRKTIVELRQMRTLFAGHGAQESSLVPAKAASQEVRRSSDRNHQEPSVEPSKRHPLVVFFEEEIKQPFPSGTFLERMEFLVEKYGIEAVKNSLLIAQERGKAFNANYIGGIVRNGGGDPAPGSSKSGRPLTPAPVYSRRGKALAAAGGAS